MSLNSRHKSTVMDELYFIPGRPYLDSESVVFIVGLYSVIAALMYCISRIERQPVFPPQIRH